MHTVVPESSAGYSSPKPQGSIWQRWMYRMGVRAMCLSNLPLNLPHPSRLSMCRDALAAFASASSVLVRIKPCLAVTFRSLDWLRERNRSNGLSRDKDSLASSSKAVLLGRGGPSATDNRFDGEAGIISGQSMSGGPSEGPRGKVEGMPNETS